MGKFLKIVSKNTRVINVRMDRCRNTKIFRGTKMEFSKLLFFAVKMEHGKRKIYNFRLIFTSSFHWWSQNYEFLKNGDFRNFGHGIFFFTRKIEHGKCPAYYFLLILSRSFYWWNQNFEFPKIIKTIKFRTWKKIWKKKFRSIKNVKKNRKNNFLY